MKPGAISATICALASAGVAALSADILGPGLWGWVMLVCGIAGVFVFRARPR